MPSLANVAEITVEDQATEHAPFARLSIYDRRNNRVGIGKLSWRLEGGWWVETEKWDLKELQTVRRARVWYISERAY